MSNREKQPNTISEEAINSNTQRGFNAEVALRQAIEELIFLREMVAGIAGGGGNLQRTRTLVEGQYLEAAGLPMSQFTESPSPKTQELTPLQKSLRSLGLAPDALAGLNEDQVQLVLKSSFRVASQIHHPDHGGDASRFRGAKESYDFLKDPTNRNNK